VILLGPALLMIGVAVVSTGYGGRQSDRRLARLGLQAVAVQVGLVVVALLLVQTLPEEPNQRDPRSTCPDMEAFGADAAMVLGWTAAAVGGFAAAAAFILANRNVWFARTGA
jgi:hypothetical protein